jgi:glutamate-1-semialdehyde 2,1-aminomutase
MNMVAPLGPVYQAGTLSGNPLAMAAGIATLRILREKKNEIYPQLEARASRLVEGILETGEKAGVKMTANRVGSMFTWFFADEPVTDWTSASKADAKRFGKFHRAMLESGIYLPPSQFEAAFLSAAHSEGDIEPTIRAASDSLSF